MNMHIIMKYIGGRGDAKGFKYAIMSTAFVIVEMKDKHVLFRLRVLEEKLHGYIKLAFLFLKNIIGYRTNLTRKLQIIISIPVQPKEAL